MTNVRRFIPVAAVAAALTITACQESGTSPEAATDDGLAPALGKSGGGDAAAAILATMDAVNAGLAAEGADYRVAMAEYVTGAGDQAGATVISKNVGNKQLGFDFVPFDGRRGWSGPAGGPMDDITYAIDQTGDAVPPFGGLTAAQTDAAIVRAMGTWDAQQCSSLPLLRNPDFGIDIGVIAFIFGLGGSPFVFADVQHAGWRDINFGGGILGATFTFGFIDGSGNFTDVDNNGKLDAAFREIYYDPSFSWADDGVTDFDVEAVALHEVGHGLSQAHFGNIFIKNDGSLKRAPAAVMNPFILGQTRSLLGTDNGGHCSIWGSWPND
jgi:hypothetical protein